MEQKQFIDPSCRTKSRHPVRAGMRLTSLLALLLAGCSEPTDLPVTPMQIGTESFNLEIADNDSTRARGLMHRESMLAGSGMIFVWSEDADREFWMKNTLIPLDLIFVNSAGKIVSIHALKPADTTRVPSAAPARWAIELNLGAAARAGVKTGDLLTIPKSARGD